MARLLFSAKALASLIRAGDSQQFGLDLKADREAIIAGASTAALGGTIDLSAYGTTILRGKKCLSYSDYSTHLVLRSIARYLRHRHRIALPSRDRIVRGVIETLLDGSPMITIRRDITSFYESIPIEPIREKLLYDTGTSSLVRKYLQSFFDIHCPIGQSSGLPRGIGLSALFAEMSMTDFDDQVRRLPGVFKYYRFSDDIMIFSTRYDADLAGQLLGALPDSMKFSAAKSSEIEYPGKKGGPDPVALEYLGYRFETRQQSDKATSRIVRVGIADRKITKLKTRIILSCRDFERQANWLLLRDRIRFISSNFKVRRHGSDVIKGTEHVFSGIFYNYKLCGEYGVRNRKLRFAPYDASELKALDGFYHSILSQRLGPAGIAGQQMEILRKFSFHYGYTHRMKARFAAERVVQIKRVWRNA